MSYAILTDLTKCIGCEACVLACKEIHGKPKEKHHELSAETLTIIERRGPVNVRRHCMHCVDPTCASVCPVAALRRTKEGPVVYDEDRCIGCRYCIMACPFEIPRYEWGTTSPCVRKCSMCYEKRVSKGEQPACTKVCPKGATIFGKRGYLIRMAERRIRKDPQRYVKHIYGVREAGGTSVLYLSDVPFEKLGFKKARMDGSYPALTWSVLSQLPAVVTVGTVLMCGISWISHRRTLLEKLHAEQARDPDKKQEM